MTGLEGNVLRLTASYPAWVTALATRAALKKLPFLFDYRTGANMHNT
jgi:hypothetical protein